MTQNILFQYFYTFGYKHNQDSFSSVICLSSFGCSTVLVNVNLKKSSLKIRTKKVGRYPTFFFMLLTQSFFGGTTEISARGLHLPSDFHISSLSPNSATLSPAERQLNHGGTKKCKK